MMKKTIFKAETAPSQPVEKKPTHESESKIRDSDETLGVKSSSVQPIRKKRLGALETPGFELGPGFYEPLNDDEIGDQVGMPEV